MQKSYYSLKTQGRSKKGNLNNKFTEEELFNSLALFTVSQPFYNGRLNNVMSVYVNTIVDTKRSFCVSA